MRRQLAAATLAAAIGLAACGSGDDQTPVACLDGAGAYLGALADAPGTVSLSGEVPISDCLAKNQTAGDLATVGAAMLQAATRLSVEARSDPGGEANVQLGYLVGAAEGGAEDTRGIHSDLIRRLQAAARYSPGEKPLPPAFGRAYREGFEAGRAHG